MLKFSGYPYLIRGQFIKIGGFWQDTTGTLSRKVLLRVEPDGTATAFKGCPVTGRPQHQAELEG